MPPAANTQAMPVLGAHFLHSCLLKLDTEGHFIDNNEFISYMYINTPREKVHVISYAHCELLQISFGREIELPILGAAPVLVVLSSHCRIQAGFVKSQPCLSVHFTRYIFYATAYM